MMDQGPILVIQIVWWIKVLLEMQFTTHENYKFQKLTRLLNQKHSDRKHWISLVNILFQGDDQYNNILAGEDGQDSFLEVVCSNLSKSAASSLKLWSKLF